MLGPSMDGLQGIFAPPAYHPPSNTTKGCIQCTTICVSDRTAAYQPASRFLIPTHNEEDCLSALACLLNCLRLSCAGGRAWVARQCRRTSADAQRDVSLHGPGSGPPDQCWRQPGAHQ